MNTTKQEFEDIKAEINKIIQKAEQLAKEAGKSISQEAEKIFGNMTGDLGSRINSVIQGSKEGGKKVDQYVKENPWLTAVIALSIGFITGLLVKSRRKD
jgi:ElaB/YqjD/DUF883 family membrane-anchored ribosome-binding protein